MKLLHISHLLRCITGLPGSCADLDTSRLGISYYTLSALDILGAFDGEHQVSGAQRNEWREWIWSLSFRGNGFGFRPGSCMKLDEDDISSTYDPPHLIMTYTALLGLSILKDDFSRLDRDGLIRFLASTQHEDGSFSPLPIGSMSSENDLRLTFCSFAICFMLQDWSGINIQNAVRFIARCRTYEGGYGGAPGCEAQGGPTYCAVASLRMLSDSPTRSSQVLFISQSETSQTIRWLVQRQRGGFQGRTGKTPDSCYSFWCGAALKILDGNEYVEPDANVAFISACQFKFGGIANEPGGHPDPYHTYLSLASLSLYPPTENWLTHGLTNEINWHLCPLDPLLNLRLESAAWAKRHIPREQCETRKNG